MTVRPVRLLVVDDEPDLRTLYELTLLREGYDIETAGTVHDALVHLNEGRFGAVITDMRSPTAPGSTCCAGSRKAAGAKRRS